MKINKNQKGFSLIEILIYSAIFTVTAGLMTGILLNITQVGEEESSARELNDQLNFVSQRINELIRKSSNIEIKANTRLQTLRLRMPNIVEDPTCIYLQNAAVKLAQGPGGAAGCSATATDLTNNKVSVTDLGFTRNTQPPGHDSVTVEITIAAQTNDPKAQLTRTLKSAVSRVSAATFDDKVIPDTSNTRSLGTLTSVWKDLYVLNSFSGDGTAVAPAYTFLTDTGTGIFHPSANVFAISTQQQERLRIDPSGNVGIGTTNPSSAHKLDVAGKLRATEVCFSGDNSCIVSANVGSAGSLSNNLDIIVNADADANNTGAIKLQTAGTDKAVVMNNGNFYVDTNTLYVDAVSGLVGIGTAVPTQKLDVQGGYIKSSTGFCIGASCIASWPSGLGGNGGLNYVAKFTPDGSNLGNSQIFDNGTNVGIGTTVPATKFNINAGALSLTNTGALNNWPAGWDKAVELNATGDVIRWANSGTGQYVGIGATTDGAIRFLTNTTDDNLGTLSVNMFVSSAGNVGIGTAAPARKLAVNESNNTSFNAPIAISRTSSVGDKIGFLEVNNSWTLGADSAGNTFASKYAVWDLTQDRWEASTASSVIGPSLISHNYNGDILFQNLPPATFAVGDPLAFNNTLALKGSGLVGIGTQSPTANLHIQNPNSAGIFIEADTDNITETDNPYLKLSQDGALTQSIVGLVGNAGFDPQNSAYTNTLANATMIGTLDANAIQIGTNDAVRITIDSTGNVGIGETAPTQLLSLKSSGNTLARLDSTGVNPTQGLQITEAGVIKTLIQRQSGNRLSIYSGDGITEDAAFLDTGNVGIGTSAPGYKLDVQGGQINASGGLCIAGVCQTNWPGGVGGSGGTNYVSKFTGATTLGNSQIFDGGTNVGIGITTPANLLHLHKTGLTDQTYLTITNGTTGSTASDGLTVGYDGIGNRAVVWNREATSLELATSNTSRILIDSSGNVGIGNTAPTQKLDVSGTIRTNNIVLSTNCADGQVLKWSAGVGTCGTDSTGSGGIGGSGTANYLPKWTAASTLGDSSIAQDASGNIGIGTASPAAGVKLDVQGNIQQESSAPILYFHETDQVDPAGWMRIAADGDYLSFRRRTAVGTWTGEEYPFTIFRNTGDVRIGNTGLNDFYYQRSTNRIGIGTAAPNQRLEVTSGNNTRIRINSTNATPATGIEITESGTAKAYVQRENGNRLAFYVGDGITQDMVIQDTGEVGIGTANPGAKLHVNGNVAVGGKLGVNALAPTELLELIPPALTDTAIKFNDVGDAVSYTIGVDDSDANKGFKINYGNTVGATNQITLLPNGNTGIGSANPQTKLEISGVGASGTFFAGPTVGGRGLWVDAGAQVGVGVNPFSGSLPADFIVSDLTLNAIPTIEIQSNGANATERSRLHFRQNSVGMDWYIEQVNQVGQDNTLRFTPVDAPGGAKTPFTLAMGNATGGYPKVGIGTNVPTGILNVIGPDDLATEVTFIAGSDTATAGAPSLKVGIGTAAPNAALDLNGDLTLRAGGFTAANGLNHNIAIPQAVFVRISGPTLAFTITGITGGVDGKIIILYNTTPQNMTIANQNAGSLAQNRIATNTGADIVTSGLGSVTLIYDATTGVWRSMASAL